MLNWQIAGQKIFWLLYLGFIGFSYKTATILSATFLCSTTNAGSNYTQTKTRELSRSLALIYLRSVCHFDTCIFMTVALQSHTGVSILVWVTGFEGARTLLVAFPKSCFTAIQCHFTASYDKPFFAVFCKFL